MKSGLLSRVRGFLSSSALPVALACVTALAVAVLAVWWGGLNQDEGWYLYAAQRVRAGFLPYRDFFFTQGPALPFVYALFTPVWAASSPLHGLLGGRLVTFLFGLASTLCAMNIAARLVSPERRTAARWTVFALLSANLYHVYFTTIPKTYALGGFFVLFGFALIAAALGLGRDARPGAVARHALFFFGGFILALASGTRISLVLILPVVGFALLFSWRLTRWAFLSFGIGGMLALALTYGFFAADPASLAGLLAAQAYHAARGGFDPFFAIGSVSRLTRGYAALAAVLFAACALTGRGAASPAGVAQAAAAGSVRLFRIMLALSFAAVFLLQLSAPFPYDDYQVPLMGLLVVLIATAFVARAADAKRALWFAVLAAGMTSVSSPLLQTWSVYGQDRFWSLRKECTDLAKLRDVASELNLMDPHGTTLLTQDLYLAVEAGRDVPRGLEMGPFSYFPALSDAEAARCHVLNTALFERLIDTTDCPVAAFSGYAFAIAAPTCAETPFARQTAFFNRLKKRYELMGREARFGQNATPLVLLRRRTADTGAQRP